MSNVKCPQCNLTNWATAITCKRCGSFLQPPQTSAAAARETASSRPAGPPPHGQMSESAPEQNIHRTPPGESNSQTQWTPPAQQQNYHEQNQQYQYQQQPPAGAAGGGYQYQAYGQPNYGYYKPAPANLKTGMAIASMILGICAFLGTLLLVGILIAPIGLILGIIAVVKANKKPEVYGGKGFAIAGIVTSSMVVIFIPLIAAIAIPNLLAARRAANEASAISTIRSLSEAEAAYMSTTHGKCGDLQTLIATKLADVSLATGEKSGYRFMIINLPAGGCEILATPLSSSTGTRSFYYSTHDSVIRAASKNGKPADRNDAPLKSGMDRYGDYNGADYEDPEEGMEAKPTRSQWAAKEGEVIKTIRKIASAQQTYISQNARGKCTELRILVANGLLPPDFADDEYIGYRLSVSSITDKGCVLRATPVEGTAPRDARSFYFDTQEGVLRGGEKQGTLAMQTDPPITG